MKSARRKLAGIGIGLAAFGFLVGLVTVAENSSSAVWAREDSPCMSRDPDTGAPLSQRQLIPPQVRLCESAVVSATVRVTCGQIPLRVMLSVDRSESMSGQVWRDVVDAAGTFVRALDTRRNPLTEIGLVTHGAVAEYNVRFTTSGNTVLGRLRGFNPRPGDQDNLPQSIDLARRELLRARPRRDDEPVPYDVLVIFSDGGQSFPPSQAVRSAAHARSSDILVISVCFENPMSDCNSVRQMATSPRHYVEARGSAGLIQIAREIRDISVASLRIEETVPDGLFVVPNSISPPADVDRTGRILSWQVRNVPATGITYTYAVTAAQVTTYTVAATTVEYSDTQNRRSAAVVPSEVLTVTSECLPDTPTPTASPTSTSSPTPTETPPSTPTPTSTPRPSARYLPILNMGGCLEAHQPLDVVLAVDASSSMAGLTPDGVVKLDAAKGGARRFVSQMSPGEHGAIVAFNYEARVAQGLTADQNALTAAIDAITMGQATRLDLAIDVARGEIASERAQRRANSVIVLLTDGRPTNVTPEEVVASAAAARRAGILIFAIGLGEDVDPDLLTRMTGSPDRYFAAATAADVTEIYDAIRVGLPCR